LLDKQKSKLSLEARIKGTTSMEVYLDYMKYGVDRILCGRESGVERLGLCGLVFKSDLFS